MAVYKATIKGMKPVLLRGSSKPKALESLVTLDSLTGEEMADAMEAGAVFYKPDVPLEPEAKPATSEAEPEKAPGKE